MTAAGSNEVSVKLLFFAKARELVSRGEARFSVQPDEVNTGDALKRALLAAYPQLAPIERSVIMALNQEYVMPEDKIHLRHDDEVAVIPPISGG